MSDDLVQRLLGVYTVPVNDGAGTLFGSDTYTRTFDMPPICAEAANEIERLRAEVEKCRRLYALRLRERSSEDVRLADTIARAERAESERDAAFRMSRCECASAECCANLVNHLRRAESAESERDALRERIEKAPKAIMDTRDALGLCAMVEEDFPPLYAIKGKRVALVVLD